MVIKLKKTRLPADIILVLRVLEKLVKSEQNLTVFNQPWYITPYGYFT